MRFTISLERNKLIGYVKDMYKQTNRENDDFDYI